MRGKKGRAQGRERRAETNQASKQEDTKQRKHASIKGG